VRGNLFIRQNLYLDSANTALIERDVTNYIELDITEIYLGRRYSVLSS
jgi:hypothetical protein